TRARASWRPWGRRWRRSRPGTTSRSASCRAAAAARVSTDPRRAAPTSTPSTSQAGARTAPTPCDSPTATAAASSTTGSSASRPSPPTPSPTNATPSRCAPTPLELLGPLGCGIQTGAGTVLRALNVGVGSTFAVMGAGAVGLSAVMAARVAGAVTIIAVDVLPSRLELAAELGATHTVNGREQDAVEEIGRITGEGVDYALDTTGLPPLIGQMIQALRQRGTAAVLGASAEDAVVGVPANAFMQSCKTLMGVV